MSIRAKEIAFVGYPVTDTARAREFYGKTLGLKESSYMEFPEMHEGAGKGAWIEYDIGAGTLAVTNCWQPAPKDRPCKAGGPNIAIEVEDLDAAFAHLEKAGVEIVVPIQNTPVCRFFVLCDLDGNGITLHQHKK